MYFFDLGLVFKFWLVLLLIGTLFLPITTRIFGSFFDKGYIFSKILGVVFISYVLFVLGIIKILPFTSISVLLLIIVYVLILIFVFRIKLKLPSRNLRRIWVAEEAFFFIAFLFWSYIKGFQPDINGLEKFMDFGFINSILRSTYFPPIDMWFPPESINYYYFGHLQTALLTKISGIEPYISYNLMLASIFGLTIVSAFSLVFSLSKDIFKKNYPSIIAGLLAGFLTALGGNLHMIYAFFEGYNGENPVPFWKLKLLPLEQFGSNYWYPNATRFIQNTIHEFPSYSFVVSDLHGHVLDIPAVLLTIALLYIVLKQKTFSYKKIFLVSFLPAIMYMTNAWDGVIYSGLIIILIIIKNLNLLKNKKNKFLNFKKISNLKPFIAKTFIGIAVLIIGFFIFTLPFNSFFKPFASGVGVVCPPQFLEGKTIGPFLFEENHCQRSPLYQLAILWGFFYIVYLTFIVFLLKRGRKIVTEKSVLFATILFFYASLLILLPEFLYAKDIYPAHYRANTMFKLGYQAYIMFSIISGFAIIALIKYWNKILMLLLFTPLVTLIMLYPYFSVRSYFGEIKPELYRGLNGISYLLSRHPDDYKAILWINKNIKGQPIIVEAQGDSYTDYARISANTGLPTVLGWTVHEWLWRGDYSVPAGRIDDVRAIYEDSLETTRLLLKKYNVSYVVVGNLEREKYPNINEEKFENLGTPIFREENTVIYQIRQ